jgi:predicted DNA-binding protein
MPTKNPRLNIVLEPALYGLVKKIADAEKVSMSLKARELIKNALELYEDLSLAAEADKRSASFSRKKAKGHDEIWAK